MRLLLGGKAMLIAPLVFGLIVGYALTVHADFLIHRNIWHGRWRLVHEGPFKWLLYPHFIHHWKAHHRHAAVWRSLLETGGHVPPAAHSVMEERYMRDWSVQYGLRCTHHGITIIGLECVLHYLALFVFTPQPYVAAALWFAVGPAAGIPAAAMPLCAVFTQICHSYYHMSPEAAEERAPKGLRWVVRSKEFCRLAREHKAHHYNPTHRDDYYGVLPFGNWLLRPLYKRN
jgi:hypothetical protein